MSRSAGNHAAGHFGRWEDHPIWGRTPAPGPGVDRAPPGGGPFGGFPSNPQEAWAHLFQHGGPFGGRSWGGGPGPWGGRRGRHGHGHGGPHRSRGGGRRGPPGPPDAGEGPSHHHAPPEAGVTADPDISTPDQLNDEPESPGTATPGPDPFDNADPRSAFPFPFPFPPGPPPPPHGGRPHPHRPRHHSHHGAHGPRCSPPNPPRGPPPQYEPGANIPPWAHRLQNLFFPSTTNPEAETADEGPQPFTPPLDIFATPSAYILHLALPGAKKSDIGVDWDHDTAQLRVAGVIHRPGDEALLASLLPTASERKVGYFERIVKLPPPETAEQARRWRGRRPHQSRAGDDEDRVGDDDFMDFEEEGREEIDAEAITAKMEDGVLIVTVPKVERGWTEVTKVDVE
ncbi:hypothetical protein B0T11DRAFT_16745 [Plectosphaerella cucumerina]|uniref:SHSP domain-containing protein n=1 Tax=Plectosphaerella cucumerina TaxID=40658 RepID=A0A8K0X983_9PEZI|nr:hypothetical protein B0T11DRAFT_16745 [Plectosphaerella cucumerina]